MVPCYNEADRLHTEQFRAYLRDADSVGFVLVDDGSTDDTRGVLDELASEEAPPVLVVSHRQNRGKGAAVRSGILRAFEENPEFVGYWDADLSTPLDAIALLEGELRSSPQLFAVLGSRFRSMGRQIERSAMRHYVGRIFATAASLTLGIPIYDTQCGAKLFRLTPRLQRAFDEPFDSRWAFDVEILARLLQASSVDERRALEAGILEYPLPLWRDVPGSKVRPLDFAVAIVDLLRVQRRYPRVSTASGR